MRRARYDTITFEKAEVITDDRSALMEAAREYGLREDIWNRDRAAYVRTINFIRILARAVELRSFAIISKRKFGNLTADDVLKFFRVKVKHTNRRGKFYGVYIYTEAHGVVKAKVKVE